MNLQFLRKLTAYAAPSFLARTNRPQTTPGEPGLWQFNTLMHAHYAAAKQEALSLAGPVIVANAFNLTLVWDGRRQEVSYIDGLTNNLKALAHVPLAITVVTQSDQAPHYDVDDDAMIRLPDSKRHTLANYRTSLHRARHHLDAADFTPDQRARQERIVDTADTVLASLASESGIPRTDYAAFINTTIPLAMENVADAAVRMLDAINAHVAVWRAAPPLSDPRLWADLRVVVVSPHMPRPGCLAGQYFERLLHVAAAAGRGDDDNDHDDDHGYEGRESRVLYMESSFRRGTDGALDHLATHIVDARASGAFFGDARRLHRDILADAAARHLDEMELPGFP
ncbi:hypothetical protein MN608_11784 [Microdochium nivale]|nr:hypothetical protein MN608_11784 [Microdochium nivale]